MLCSGCEPDGSNRLMMADPDRELIFSDKKERENNVVDLRNEEKSRVTTLA